jgi:hypothetical protein
VVCAAVRVQMASGRKDACLRTTASLLGPQSPAQMKLVAALEAHPPPVGGGVDAGGGSVETAAQPPVSGITAQVKAACVGCWTELKPLLHPHTRWVFWGICYLWFAASMSYYGISYNAGNLSDDVYSNWVLTSALPLFPSTGFGVWLIDQPRMGRTRANAAMFGACCLCIGAGAVLGAGPAATACSMAGNFCANAVFNCVYISVPELYPTRYRATVMGMASASARIGSMLASYAPYVLGSSGTLALVTVTCCLATVVSVTALPETLNQPMPSAMPLPPRRRGVRSSPSSADAGVDGLLEKVEASDCPVVSAAGTI